MRSATGSGSSSISSTARGTSASRSLRTPQPAGEFLRKTQAPGRAISYQRISAWREDTRDSGLRGRRHGKRGQDLQPGGDPHQYRHSGRWVENVEDHDHYHAHRRNREIQGNPSLVSLRSVDKTARRWRGSRRRSWSSEMAVSGTAPCRRRWGARLPARGRIAGRRSRAGGPQCLVRAPSQKLAPSDGRRAFYTTGMEHSPTSATGTRWERTPWHAAPGGRSSE